MKRMKIYFSSLLFLSLLLTMGADGFGQSKKIEKTYRWKQEVSRNVKFSFSNYDCNLTIHTWDKPEIEYKLSVKATMKSEKDARELNEYIEKLRHVLSDKKRIEYVQHMCNGYSLDETILLMHKRRLYWQGKTDSVAQFYHATLGRFFVKPTVTVCFFVWSFIEDAWELRKIFSEWCPHVAKPRQIE